MMHCKFTVSACICIGLVFPESAKGVILFPWNNITCFGNSGLVQPTGTNVWAARFACLHGPLKRERERERGERREERERRDLPARLPPELF